jgi:hypothetical protein
VRELVRVVPLALIYHGNGVPDELIHAVVALTRAHFCYRGRIDILYDHSFACTMFAVNAVVRLGHA